MKRRVGGLEEASEEKARRAFEVKRWQERLGGNGLPRASGLTDRDIKERYWRRKVARESGDLNAIRWSFGAPSLGRISLMALGLTDKEPRGRTTDKTDKGL